MIFEKFLIININVLFMFYKRSMSCELLLFNFEIYYFVKFLMSYNY